MKKTLPASLGVVLIAWTASAHTMLIDPAARTPCTAASALCKTAPCGGVAAGAPVKTFVTGSSYDIAYQEVIDHDGHYRVALSTNGELGFDSYILGDNLPDTTNAQSATPHDYTFPWIAPDTANCDPCVLQVTQFMSATATTYYSCSDIRILPAGSTTPTPTPTATPTPNPGNPDDGIIHGGCACTVASSAPPLTGTLAFSLFAAALLLRRRSKS